MSRSLTPLWSVALLASALLAACNDAPTAVTPTTLSPSASILPDLVDEGRKARLGRAMFQDENLSLERNQSCESCHTPAWGWTSPDLVANLGGGAVEGSVAGRAGARKPMSAAYASQAPIFECDPNWRGFGPRCKGGNFWDGRATGERLGSPVAEQAQAPFTNPVEMALRDPACVVYRVSEAEYSGRYVAEFGPAIKQIRFPKGMDSLCEQEGPLVDLPADVRAQVDLEFDNIAIAIGDMFEDSRFVNTFTSKYDAYRAGLATLTEEETLGMELWVGAGRCNFCHGDPFNDDPFLATDYEFDNIGSPKNPDNPIYATDPGFVDLGLGGFTGVATDNGQFRVPTARNADLAPYPGAPKAFMHNGALKSLEEVVHFYNTARVMPDCATLADAEFGVNCWPAPEVADNRVPPFLVGGLGLTPEQEAAIVAFTRALTDGYLPSRPGSELVR